MNLVSKIKENGVHAFNIIGSFIPGVNQFTNPWSSTFFTTTSLSNNLKYNKKTNIAKSLIFSYVTLDLMAGIYSMVSGDNSDYSTGIKNTLYQGIESGVDLVTLVQMGKNLKDSFGMASYYELPRTTFKHIKDAWSSVKKIGKKIYNNKIKTLALATSLATTTIAIDYQTGFLKYPIGGALHYLNNTETTAQKGPLWERIKSKENIENILEGKSLTSSFNESFFSNTNAIPILIQGNSNIDNKRGITIYDRNGKELGNIKSGSKFRTIDKFPKQLIEIVKYQEDKKFNEHNGINWLSLARALMITSKESIKSLNINFKQGGSTISQQVASFLYPKPTNKLERLAYKALELATTLQIEYEYSKDDIMSIYLNTCEFSNQITGYADAAEFYFNRDVNNLTLTQMVMLATIPNNPALHPYYESNNPNSNYSTKQLNHLQERAKMLVGRMIKEKYINETQGKTILSNLSYGLEPKGKSMNFENSGLLNVINVGIKEELIRKGLDEENYHLINLYKGRSLIRNLPTAIHTTIDKDIQTQLTKNVKNNSNLKGEEYSYVIIDANNGEIIALETSEEYGGTGVSLFGKKQFASTIKPFIYSMALEEGIISNNSILDDRLHNLSESKYEGKVVKDEDNKETQCIVFKKDEIKDYVVKNFNGEFFGDAPWQQHLKNSNNIIPVSFLFELENKISVSSFFKTGPQQFEKFFKESGINITEINKYQYSSALGTCEVSNLDLVNLYTVFDDGNITINKNFPGRLIKNLVVLDKEIELINNYDTREWFNKEHAQLVRKALEGNYANSMEKSGTTTFTNNGNINRYVGLIQGNKKTYVIGAYSTGKNKLSSTVHKNTINNMIKYCRSK